ncbi:MAG: glycosyltransferase [Solirubrobacterales bacterium]
MHTTPNPSHSPYVTSPLTGVSTISLEPDPNIRGGDPVNHSAAQMLPEEVCRHFRLIPVGFDGNELTVAMADPSDAMAQNVALALTSDPIEVVLAPPHQIERAIDRVWSDLDHYGPLIDPDAFGLETPGDGNGASASVVEHGRLGDILVARGQISEQQLEEALERQLASGSRLGEILYFEMGLAEADLAAAVADQLRVPLVDLEGIEPQPEALEVIPEALQREGRCVPLAIDDEVLYVAITDPLGDETYEAIRELTDLRIRTYMVTRSDLEPLLREIHREEHVRAARAELLTRFPEDYANRVLSGSQRIFFILFLVAVLIGFVLAPLLTGIILVILCVSIYLLASLYKFKLFYDAFGRRREFDFTPKEVARVDDRELPRYTILVPLFREAAVVPRLIENLTKLDYPPSKLEILLLCEEEDDATIDAIRKAGLSPYFKLTIIPDSQPKTKPMACNYGIQQATGKFVVIYDAEDQPDPDQLKKVLMAWERSEDNVVCVQSKLNYFNTDQNLPTRFFSTEYARWFDLLLPGFDASGAPIPLGGTSNHFNREALIEVGAWDPFNVTEDANLGLRLHKAGYKTVMLNSTTLEESRGFRNPGGGAEDLGAGP